MANRKLLHQRTIKKGIKLEGAASFSEIETGEFLLTSINDSACKLRLNRL
jgi:hypothetical protein